MSQANTLLTMPFFREIQQEQRVSDFGGKKLKAKINPKYVLTDEQLSDRLSDKEEEYQITPHTEKDYKEIIDSHRPRFSKELKKWL